MNQKELVEVIAEQINKVSTLVEKIKNDNKELSTIEIDIAKERLRQMYDNFELLSNISRENALLFEKNETKKNEITVEKPVVVIKKKIEKPTIKKVDILPKAEEKKVEEIPVAEPKKKEIVKTEPISKEIKVEKKVFEKKEIKENKPKNVSRETSLADLFSDNSATLSDKFHDTTPIIAENLKIENEDNSVGAKLQRKKITDIRAAIGVNEKFLFINELFVGEFKIYESSIETLNETKNAEEALNVLETLKTKHNWNNDMPAFNKLLHIVERKFN